MSFDQRALRQAYGRFLTGVTVVTTCDQEGAPVGFTANSFTSVALDPPLLLVCPGRHLSRFRSFDTAKRFGVSILAEGQEDISNLFASGKGDRFAQCAWETKDDMPLIEGRAAGFVCDVTQRIPAGDHIILLGHVRHFDDAEQPGLGFGPGGYFGRKRDQAASVSTSGASTASVLLEREGAVYLTSDGRLPTKEVGAGESPVQALDAYLRKLKLKARLGAVYSLYDEACGTRRVVFRGQLLAPTRRLEAHQVHQLPGFAVSDAALRSLLARFATEYQQRTFGFYFGTAQKGDILPVSD